MKYPSQFYNTFENVLLRDYFDPILNVRVVITSRYLVA